MPCTARRPTAESSSPSSSFTNEAIAYADRVAARVVLIDGIALAQLMVTHNIGVQDRETYVIKRVDEDFFEEA